MSKKNQGLVHWREERRVLPVLQEKNREQLVCRVRKKEKKKVEGFWSRKNKVSFVKKKNRKQLEKKDL